MSDETAPPAPPSAVERAVARIRVHINGMQGTGERRLPTTRELARMCDVSTVTVWRAVAVLKARGVVMSRRGGSIRLRDDTQNGQGAGMPARTTAGVRLRERLRGAILRGHYPAHRTLGSYKQMAQEYGNCYRTLRSALGELVREGLLERHGQSYRAVSPRTRLGRATVVLIARALPDGSLQAFTSRTMDHYRALEDECASAGVQLTFAPYHALVHPGSSPRTMRQAFEDPLGSRTLVGTIIWRIGILNPPELDALVERIAGYGRPVALLDESGDAPAVHAPRTAPFTGHFAVPYGKRSGLAVGGYLRALGHRTVAYICHLHRNAWSQARLDGLTEALCAPGVQGRVVPFVLDEFAWPEDHIRTARGIVDDVKERLRVPRGSAPVGPLLSHALRTISDQLESVLLRDSLRAALRPLFESALADSSITAWVGANDEVALEARAFLEERSRRVPADISVVGMDDSAEASVHHLTSYSFNGRAAMRAMVGYVLAPGHAPHGTERSPLEIDGAVVTRHTCASVV